MELNKIKHPQRKILTYQLNFYSKIVGVGTYIYEKQKGKMT